LDYKPPRGYVCYRAPGPIVIDGRLDDAGWKGIPWTEDFMDIEGDRQPRPRLRTRAKMAWDENYLYIAADLEEPHVWATLTKHDSVIFHDPDFEVFLNPNGDNHNYCELESNALNATWDLLLTRPYRDAGHAIDDWDIHGLKTAVHVDGTINNPSDTDRGWSIEIAWPWTSLRQLTDRPMPPDWLIPGRIPDAGPFKGHKTPPSPPSPWECWRINFSRVEWDIDIVDGKYRKAPDRKEHNWVWSPQGIVDMHQPEHWGYLQFSNKTPGSDRLSPDPTGPARDLLHRIYHAQRKFYAENGKYASALEALGLAGLTDDSFAAPPRVETTSRWFEAGIPVKNGPTVRIRADSQIVTEP
jgi:hypothetical protein